jgi:hypothetical protein
MAWMCRPSLPQKNITDSITIEILRKITEFKKPKTQSSTMMCIQATIPISVKQPSSKSYEKMIKVALPTSTLKDVKEPNFTNSIIMVPPPPLPINMSSSSTSINLVVCLVSNEITWIIDSGYTHQMTGNKINFKIFNKLIGVQSYLVVIKVKLLV